jgi:hypothetical protein
LVAGGDWNPVGKDGTCWERVKTRCLVDVFTD